MATIRTITTTCDKCGKELLWYGNIMPSNMFANINTMAQQFNTDGYKTYDAPSGQWLDLCMECKYSQANKDENWVKIKNV